MLIDYIKKYNEKNLKDFINEKNEKGITALHYASYKGNYSIIKLLINLGADEFSLSNMQLNVFHFCAQGKKPNSLMYFYLTYKHHRDMEKRNLINLIKDVDKGGSTPLHWAAYSDAEEVLLYILNLDIFQNEREKQEFIDKGDNKGKTAYILVLRVNQLELFQNYYKMVQLLTSRIIQAKLLINWPLRRNKIKSHKY